MSFSESQLHWQVWLSKYGCKSFTSTANLIHTNHHLLGASLFFDWDKILFWCCGWNSVLGQSSPLSVVFFKLLRSALCRQCRSYWLVGKKEGCCHCPCFYGQSQGGEKVSERDTTAVMPNPEEDLLCLGGGFRITVQENEHSASSDGLICLCLWLPGWPQASHPSGGSPSLSLSAARMEPDNGS